MFFQWNKYGPALEPLLPYLGDGQRPLPLVKPVGGERFRLPIQKTPHEYFPDGLGPAGAMAGLCLYTGDWEQAHFFAQDDDSREGSYWHGIVHRLEPDPTNAGYWFGRVGSDHPVFAALSREANAIGRLHGVADLSGRQTWDPLVFVQLCGRAAQMPGSRLARAAQEVQLVEWQLLFDYCAGARSRSVEA